jgi:hypothetical protein
LMKRRPILLRQHVVVIELAQIAARQSG